ncbi:MAG: hypothetical protein PHQ86_01870 [Dehalococcoidales bacterium]|nr:hypothetical protein [Dehalococcoidales bacterium]
MGFHKPHRKEVIAAKVLTQKRIIRWMLRLDRILLTIELEKKDKKR